MRTEDYTSKTLPEFERSKIKHHWYHSFKMEWECKWMESSVYKQYYNDIIDRVMKKNKVMYRCFYIRDMFIGWICYENDFIHYMYLKKMFREKDNILKEFKNKVEIIKPDYETKKIDVTFLSYFTLKTLGKKCYDNKFRRFG